MTSHGSWVLQTVESNVIGATVGAIVGGTVSGLYKRAVRLEAKRIEHVLIALDHLLGGDTAEFPTAQEGTMKAKLKRARKALAAAASVVFLGVLTWAESADLEPVIGPLLPPLFRPLVGVALGGIAVVASVYGVPNAPATTVDSATPAATPAVPAPSTRASANAIPSPSIAALVAGVTPTPSTVTSATSVVPLLPVPVRDFQ